MIILSVDYFVKQNVTIIVLMWAAKSRCHNVVPISLQYNGVRYGKYGSKNNDIKVLYTAPREYLRCYCGFGLYADVGGTISAQGRIPTTRV